MSKLKIKVHEDADNGKAFIGVTSIGKQALQKIEQTNPSFTGKTLPAIAKEIASDIMFNLSYNCNLSDDVEECFQRMLEFGLDDIYVLWSKGWTSIMIARKIMKTLNLTPTASNPQESRSKKTETFASPDDIEKIENYLRPLMVGKTYKDTIFLEKTIEREINELFRKSDFHTLDGAEEDDLQFSVSFYDSWEDDDDITAYEYVYETDDFLLFSLVVLVKALDDNSAKITELSAKVGD